MTAASGPSAQSDRVRLLPVAQSHPEISGSGEIDLGQLVEALRRRHRLALLTLVGTVLLGGLLTSYQRAFRPIFQGGFKLLVSEPISQDRGDGSGTQLENLALPDEASTNSDTLIQVLTSPLLLGPVEQELGLPEAALESAVSIELAKGSGGGKGGDGVLAINLQWPDPNQGQRILEQLSRDYLTYSLRQRQEKLNQGLNFLGQQAPALQQRVNELQNRLSNFRQANSFVEPGEQATAILARRETLRSKLMELQQQEARLNALEASVRSGRLNSSELQGADSSQGDLLPGGVFSNLAEELIQVEKDIAKAEASYTDSAPQVRELRERRDQLRPLLQRRQLDAIEASQGVLRSQKQIITQQFDQLSQTFTTNPQRIKQYESLQQQLQVARENLTSYIKARETFRLQVAQRTLPWRVISPPRFGGKPVKPDLGRNLTLSFLLGSLAAVGLALLRDRLDYVFHSPNELKQSLAVPMLGVVPFLPKRKEATIAEAVEAMDGGMRFDLRESLRNLFANFRLLRADKTVRLVAVSSAAQGEGKTTTAALFAQTLAQIGQKVLLVDADMRRPMLHQYVGVENNAGLATLLADPSLSLQEVLQPVQTGLDLLPAGPLPPDATRLFSSQRCRDLVEQIRQLEGYDLVLFDTAPALLLSDPVLLAEHLDGVLFVVGMERVNRDLPMQAIHRLRATGSDVLGVLANLAVQPSWGSYGYGYGYGYSYSYGGAANGYRNTYSDQTDDSSDNGEVKPSSSRHHRRRPSLRRTSRKLIHWLDGRS